MRSEHTQTWINHLERTDTPDSRNTPSTTNLEEEEIVDVLGNDGNSSMPEHIKRPDPWRKMMMTKKCVPVTGPVVAQRVGRGIALLFHDSALEGGEWSAARPGRTLSPGKTRYPLYRRLGGPQGRSGLAENLAPPGFDPRTVQPVISRYTD